jgi:hypothetical protein
MLIILFLHLNLNCIIIPFCLFPDYSHGGYSNEHDDDLNNYGDLLNVIPTHDPFKLLTNLKRQEPYFDPNVNQNVTALVGKSAYLNCIVKNLGNKTVEYKMLNL